MVKEDNPGGGLFKVLVEIDIG